MSISITSNAVTITNETLSFEDIYQYAVDNNKTAYVKKLGDSYLIKGDVYLKNNSNLLDTNKFITVEGDLFQIEKGSKLELGRIRTNGSTFDGCTLNIPNVKLAYGFGNISTTNSGDLIIYGCTVNAFGFWGFFEGNNHVEIIDCFIDGFGRVSGPNSKIKNIKYKRSHGRYGSISAKGDIALMENTSSYDSFVYNNLKCSVYHNPELTGDLTLYYGEYDGYDDLAYIESFPGKNVLELRGTSVKAGYNLFREANNVDFYHSFRYKGQITTLGGDLLSNVRLIVKDKNGDVVHDVNSTQTGEFDLWIKYYEDIAGGDTQILTPHTFEFTKGDTTFTSLLYMDKNYEHVPIFLVEEGVGGGTGSCNLLDGQLAQMQQDIIAAIGTSNGDIITNITNDIDVKINNAKNAVIDVVVNGDGTSPGTEELKQTIIDENERVERKVGQIQLALSEDIDETTELIRSHSDISVIA